MVIIAIANLPRIYESLQSQLLPLYSRANALEDVKEFQIKIGGGITHT